MVSDRLQFLLTIKLEKSKNIIYHMNTKLGISLAVAFFAITACQNGKPEKDSRKVYNSINLYFSPAEDYLLRHEFFPNFINYPDDRVKLGLKGKVEDVKYTTVHTLGYLFDEEGKTLAKVFTEKGSDMQQSSIYRHDYDDSGRLVQITEEDLVDQGRGFRSIRKKEIDKIISHTASGKPLKRAILDLNSNRTDHIVCYEYDANDICRGIGIAEDSPNKNANAMAFTFRCDEKGRIIYIHAKRTRIPYRLARGERKITPTYDLGGRLVSIKEMAIPTNNEAYRIDSIASVTNYKYNKEGDIIECVYSEIVHPRSLTADFTLTFAYEYDKQGNWIKKRIMGEVYVLDGLMNSYYYGRYPINPLGNATGEVVIEREIKYYNDNL